MGTTPEISVCLDLVWTGVVRQLQKCLNPREPVPLYTASQNGYRPFLPPSVLIENQKFVILIQKWGDKKHTHVY